MRRLKFPPLHLLLTLRKGIVGWVLGYGLSTCDYMRSILTTHQALVLSVPLPPRASRISNHRYLLVNPEGSATPFSEDFLNLSSRPSPITRPSGYTPRIPSRDVQRIVYHHHPKCAVSMKTPTDAAPCLKSGAPRRLGQGSFIPTP